MVLKWPLMGKLKKNLTQSLEAVGGQENEYFHRTGTILAVT